MPAEDNCTVIKQFKGFSGSRILLCKNANTVFVRKIGNIERNYQKMQMLLEHEFDIPRIINKTHDVLDMEYIHGLDIKTFIKIRNVESLLEYIKITVNKFKKINNLSKDYSETYHNQLSFIDNDEYLPFNSEQLITRLPKILDSSLCHGDFTLENIIHSSDKFYMIDPSTGVYDSWIFDIAKLRQDLDCLWFVRNEKKKEEYKIELQYIKSKLELLFPDAFDDHLYILMLLRVYKYASKDTLEHRLLVNEVNRLWK